jgi:peptidoglycan/LPS O-acetylase OafA/YrhL
MERGMSFWKLSPWLSRLVILAVAALFAMISFKFVVDPQHAAAGAGITLNSAIGTTNTRAGFGGFPLGFAMLLAFSLFSSRRLLAALAAIATLAAVILSVRLYGIAQDGTFGESAHLLIPEAAILAVSLAAALIEVRRRALDVQAG